MTGFPFFRWSGPPNVLRFGRTDGILGSINNSQRRFVLITWNARRIWNLITGPGQESDFNRLDPRSPVGLGLLLHVKPVKKLWTMREMRLSEVLLGCSPLEEDHGPESRS